jgi:tetratricopeptide (TPR) repeat protein
VWMPRLWRSRPYVPFVGVVHEHLDRDALTASGETGKEYDTDIVINHDGYAGGATTGKYEKYIPMLREELVRRPGQIYYEVKLACTLAAARKPEAPAELAKLGDRLLSEQDRDEQEVIVASAFGPILDAVPEAELRSPRTDTLLRLARGWFPETPVVAWHAAQLHVRRGELKGALDALLDLEKMAETGNFDRRTPFLAPIMAQALWTNLGIVAHQLGRKDVAKRNYERLLKADPANPVAKQNIGLL